MNERVGACIVTGLRHAQRARKVGHMMRLSWLSFGLGMLFVVCGWLSWRRPAAAGAFLRRFPRSVPWGTALMLLATGWFLYYVSLENIADFAPIKPHLMLAFGVIGLGTCLFVKDYLGARGLAVLWLLLAKLMLDTGRAYLLDSKWVLVNQALAYLFILAGIWVTISPFRLRDWIYWCTQNQRRFQGMSMAALGLGTALILLSVTAYRELPP
ncbi:MAG: hypothetical protein RMN51_00095 [Verrucomicrobiota bacterium]|nr:hypothetical protein [Limisphaera sp.]MDW8380504.1 hypothetical protein [Verrucomicrobiota bacterium]